MVKPVQECDNQPERVHTQTHLLHTHTHVNWCTRPCSLSPPSPFLPLPARFEYTPPLTGPLDIKHTNISNTQTYTQTHTRTKTSMCVHPLARSLSPSPLLPFFFVRVFLNNQLDTEAHSSCDHTSPLTRRFDITHTHTHIRTHMSNVYTHYSSFSPRHPVCSFPLLLTSPFPLPTLIRIYTCICIHI